MMLIENDILLRKHVGCIFMLKYYIANSFQQLRKTLINFLTYLGLTKIGKFVFWSEHLN